MAQCPNKRSSAQKQKPHELLWTMSFEGRVYLCRNLRFLKKKLKFQLTYGSSNSLSLVAIDFTQTTWFTTSKVNCKKILNFCQKNFQLTFRLQNTLRNCTWSGPIFHNRHCKKSNKYFVWQIVMDRTWGLVLAQAWLLKGPPRLSYYCKTS